MRNRKRELFDEHKKKKKDTQILQIQLKRTEDLRLGRARRNQR